MCSECKEEYENPLSRCYHSETIVCYKCGMQLSLIDKNGDRVTKRNEIEQFVNALEKGSIVALKGIGGYHLICDSTNKKSIEKLRKLKRRVKKPFAIMVKNLEYAEKIATINKAERELLDSNYKPIVLLYKKESYNLLDLIAPDINQVGIMLAYTPLHHLILEKFSKPIVVTSANTMGESIAKNREEILLLSNMWDFCLDNDRDIENYCDDSVAFVENENIYMLRNARGYAPKYFDVKNSRNIKALALGANQKSTIAILNQNKIVISPYLGELNSLGSLERYKENIERFESLYNCQNKLLVHDKHPKYESTKYAYELHKKEKSDLLGVQYHYAHALASMGLNDLENEVLAVSFDGLGYGDDGKLWGGEFFLCDINKYERVAYIQEFKLLGADKAIKEPRRVAFGILIDMYGKDVLKLKNSVTNAFTTIELQTLYTAHQKNINSPLTTSMGRVFDAVASMLDIVQVSSYEGESGLYLESYYDTNIQEHYEYRIQGKSIVLHTMFEAILEEKDASVAVSKFFNTAVEIIANMKKSFQRPIVVSGGVFQNRVLVRLLKDKIPDIYLPQEFVSNDGAIAYGQAIAASSSS